VRQRDATVAAGAIVRRNRFRAQRFVGVELRQEVPLYLAPDVLAEERAQRAVPRQDQDGAGSTPRGQERLDDHP
jgi:hypothetical protein